MAEFCKQCAHKLGTQSDFAGIAKKGEVKTVLCENCGQIDIDHQGLCLTHMHSTYKVQEDKGNWKEIQNSFLIFFGIMIVLIVLLKLKSYIL